MSQKVKFFFRIFESLPDPLVIYDRHYRINLINPALGELYQVPVREAIGKHCYEVFHRRHSVCEDCQVREVFRSGATRQRQKIITLPDGRQRHFITHCYPVKDGAGKIMQALEHSREVTEYLSLEHRLQVAEAELRHAREQDVINNRRLEEALARRYQELSRTQHQLETLYEITRQLSAKNSLEELVSFLEEITRELFPDSDALFLIMNASRDRFLPLGEYAEGVAQPLRRFCQKLEQTGRAGGIIRCLKDIKDPHIVTGDDRHKLPVFLQEYVNDYASWFGLPIFVQQESIGYFFLGSQASQMYRQEDLHFIHALFAQNAGYIRQLVLQEAKKLQWGQEETEKVSHGGIIGKSKKMQEIYELIDLISKSDATVLITGENGTGKELVAKAIHQHSHRQRGPFVVANCSAYSPTLLESELFGHERGAFTGAIRQRKGRIERAHGGTLFLDEIGDISPATQVLLLRFLQDHCFERVGGERPIEADVRVLAATNRDLRRQVEAREFRDDLYYRLNVISIHLPLLRERKEDIPLLTMHFLEKYNQKENKQVVTFAANAMEALMEYEWPGNVRQLENAISHAVILVQGEVIRKRHLPRFLRERVTTFVSTSLAQNERHLILRVLQECNWNKHDAARRLQVSRSTLYSKLRRYGLEKIGRRSVSIQS
jgi:PAS domain S-box-containing protein